MLPQTKLTEMSLLWKLTRVLMRTLKNMLLWMRPQTKLMELLMEWLRRLLSWGEETAPRCKRSRMLGRNCRPK